MLAELPRSDQAGDGQDWSRLAMMQGALAAGYAARLQERTLSEQDAIRSAAVTARLEAENAARASEARFQAVFAGAAIGIGIGDMEGNILDGNLVKWHLSFGGALAGGMSMRSPECDCFRLCVLFLK